VPAAAVIPAPIAYIKVVAVKKLVVEFRGRGKVWSKAKLCCCPYCLAQVRLFTVKKLECLKQAFA
jgi:hypothetical protein